MQVSELSSSSGSRPEVSPPDAFRSIKPADYVARNANVLAGSAPLADNEAPSVVVPVVVPRLPTEVVSAAEPVEETARIEVTVKTPGSTSPDQALLPEPSTAPLPDLPPQVEASDLASTVPERSGRFKSCVMSQRPSLVPAWGRNSQFRPNLKFACRGRTPTWSRPRLSNRAKVPT